VLRDVSANIRITGRVTESNGIISKGQIKPTSTIIINVRVLLKVSVYSINRIEFVMLLIISDNHQ